MSLREDLVRVAVFGFWDGELSGQPAPDDLRRGERALDAILDYLEANADEWDRAALAIAASDRISQLLPVDFLAALRIQENQ